VKDDWSIPYIPMDAVAREEERRREAAQAAFIDSLKRTTWEWTLAHNLAIAGALCHSWRLGRVGLHMERLPNPDFDFWRPGCGRSAP